MPTPDHATAPRQDAQKPVGAPDADVLAVLIESVAARAPVDVYGLAAILASERNRAVIVRALKAHDAMLAALLACREYWRDVAIPCRVDLHDQVTSAIFVAMGPASYDRAAVEAALRKATGAAP